MQAIGGRNDEILLPHTFPFSEIVPKTMHMLHRLVMHFIVYTSQLALRTQATDLVQLLNTAVEQMSAWCVENYVFARCVMMMTCAPDELLLAWWRPHTYSIADAAKGMDEGTPLSRISQLSIDAMCLGQVRKRSQGPSLRDQNY
jgi:hypothetical protein